MSHRDQRGLFEPGGWNRRVSDVNNPNDCSSLDSDSKTLNKFHGRNKTRFYS